MSKIETLTPEQVDLMPAYRDKWIAIGLSTEPGDDVLAEQIIRKHYVAIGYTEPKSVIFVDSPLEGAHLAKLAEANNYEDFMSLMKARKYDIDGQEVNLHGYGQFDASWLSYSDFFKRETTLKIDDKIDDLIELAKHISFYWVFEEVAIVSRKMTSCSLEDGVLHNYMRPAVEFKDGFCVYAIKGQGLTYEQWEIEGRPFRSSLGKTVFKKL